VTRVCVGDVGVWWFGGLVDVFFGDRNDGGRTTGRA